MVVGFPTDDGPRWPTDAGDDFPPFATALGLRTYVVDVEIDDHREVERVARSTELRALSPPKRLPNALGTAAAKEAP